MAIGMPMCIHDTMDDHGNIEFVCSLLCYALFCGIVMFFLGGVLLYGNDIPKATGENEKRQETRGDNERQQERTVHTYIYVQTCKYIRAAM